MMKPMTPPIRGGVHLALSEGCGLWKPVLAPAEKTEKPTRSADCVTEGVTDGGAPGKPVAQVTNAGTSSKKKP